jgi:C4-type Zn-finger protein
MIKFLARTCPICRSHFRVLIAIAEPKGEGKFQPIHGLCTRCGYQIAWALIKS